MLRKALRVVVRTVVVAAATATAWLAWYLYFPSSVSLCTFATEEPGERQYHRKMVRVTGVLLSTSSPSFFLIRQPRVPTQAPGQFDCWASVSIEEPTDPLVPRFSHDAAQEPAFGAFAASGSASAHQEVQVTVTGRIERLRHACFAPDVVIHAQSIAFRGSPILVSDHPITSE